MLPFVQFRIPGRGLAELHIHALIGRSPRADLQLNDPRISDIHAMISLRHGQLFLKALGGGLRVADDPRPRELELRPGLEFELGKSGIRLQVVALNLPDTLPSLQVGQQPPVLLGESCWHWHPSGRLVAGEHPDAPL